jgi:hypothetical protein
MATSVALVGAGGLLIGLTLLDIFLTVLHPQAESPFSSRLHMTIWFVLRQVARPLRGRACHRVLGLGLPLMVAALMVAWLLMLFVGFGLIYSAWIDVPGAFRLPDGTTTPDWRDALYFSGVTLGTVGYGDIQPVEPWLRMAATVQGVSGIAVLSLSVAYILEVYPMLQRKAVLAVLLNEATDGQVDGLPLLARYLRGGRFEALASLLTRVNAELLTLAEAHRRLTVLHYAHPVEMERSFLRILLVVRNLVATLRFGLAGGAGQDWSDDPRVLDLHDSLLYALYTLGSSLHLPLAGSARAEEEAGAAFRHLCERLATLDLPTPRRCSSAAGEPAEFDRACSGYVHFTLLSDTAILSYLRNSGYSADEATADAVRPDHLVSMLETNAPR